MKQAQSKSDFLLAIISINITSRLMSYLHMNQAKQMPDMHKKILAGRYSFKAFSRLNS